MSPRAAGVTDADRDSTAGAADPGLDAFAQLGRSFKGATAAVRRLRGRETRRQGAERITAVGESTRLHAGRRRRGAALNLGS